MNLINISNQEINQGKDIMITQYFIKVDTRSISFNTAINYTSHFYVCVIPVSDRSIFVTIRKILIYVLS